MPSPLSEARFPQPVLPTLVSALRIGQLLLPNQAIAELFQPGCVEVDRVEEI